MAPALGGLPFLLPPRGVMNVHSRMRAVLRTS
jgi:hypothetical protein